MESSFISIPTYRWLLFILLCGLKCSQGSVPVITKQPVDSKFVRGKSGKLFCDTRGKPTPVVTWYKDDFPVNLGNKISQLNDDSLFFKKIRKRNDEGTYWCVAKNSEGEVRSKKVRVSVMFLNRKFKTSPQNKDVSLLAPVEFKCAPPGGNPPPTIKWRKNSQIVQSNERVKMEVDESVYYLRITKALQEDAGNYSCVASNNAEERYSQSANLRVLVPPAITLKQAVIQANEEEDIELSCQSIGVPNPTIKWYKASGGLPLSNRLQYITPNRIKIESVQLSDAGEYTCRADNSQGFAEEKITVIVKMLPKFLTRPGNLKVGVGQDARFECRVSAEIGYKIIWQKQVGAQSWLLFKGQRQRVLIGDDGSLTIENVQKEDEASYVCTVISGGKAVSATARLVVADTVTPLPKVSVVPFNQTVLEGKDINVTCIAKGTPKPVVYWKSASTDARITNVTDGVVLLNNGFKHMLILKDVGRSDSGSYRCIATNGERTVSKVAYLIVVPVPKTPEPPDYVDFRNVTETSVILQWKASRDPPGAPVTSYVISVSDIAGREWKAIASNIKKLEYTVRNLTPGTWYKFKVTAVNNVGLGKPSKSSGNIKTNPSRRSPQPFSKAFSSTQKPVDKLLDLSLSVNAFRRSKADEYNISWVPVTPPNRVNGYEVHWKKATDQHYKDAKVPGGASHYYILKGLEPGTPYKVKIRAFNDEYNSVFSDVEAFSTMTKQQVSISPPCNVTVRAIKEGSVLVTWEPSKESRLTGYEIVWIPLDGTSVGTVTVHKSKTSFLIEKLDPGKPYHVTVALVVDNLPGLKSEKYQITPKSVKPKDKDEKQDDVGDGVVGGTNSGRKSTENGGTSSRRSGSTDSGILKIVKEPWFIGAVGGCFCLSICVFVIVIACRRRKRKRPPYFGEQSNGLLQPNRTPVNSINRTRASYRDSAFWLGEPETLSVPAISAHSNRNAFKVANGTLDNERPEMKPLIGGKSSNEGIEMRAKPVNGDVQKVVKETNNLRRPCDAASVPNSSKESFLNNLRRDKSMEFYAASPKMNLSRNADAKQQDKPRLKIQGAFDNQQPYVDDDEGKKNMLERHAEIVRTSNKKFESDLANCMENNTQATWKREKMKEAPEVLTSGEDTLRRKAKSSFKPMPKLEVLDWADYPTASSMADSSAGSPPSSPKTSASAFSDNNGSRATSRASQGSTTSLNRYAYGVRSGHVPSSRRMSQSSSMMSSELYQSEMEPSVYSDATSEKKKPKNKAALPPPIDLDGLTSDILLQWAESVTNSSPSSSGSSSPSRLSAISSDGSFLTDEDFAHAVAAVVKCGGFTNFDYSLSNMPGLQAPPQSQPVDHQKKMKMEKIDAMIASKGKPFKAKGASSANQLSHRQDTRSPPSVTPISFSSYLSGNAKRTGPSSLSNGPYNKHRQRIPNHNDVTGLRFSNDNESALSFGTPLTMSNLRQHDSSLGREKHHTKPLTVSNLKQHDSSLERNKKLPTDETRNVVVDDDDDDDGEGEEDDINDDDDVFGGKTALANGAIAQPLSVTSALERNESLGSTKDSKSSINSEFEGRGTSERRKDNKAVVVVNLNDPASSTGTSTASTVRTSQDQSEC